MMLDEHGLIVSKTELGTLDGGDSLAETGRINFLKLLCGIKDDMISLLEAGMLLTNDRGEWIRSPSQWTDPKDISRDQLDPMVMAWSLRGFDAGYDRLRDNWFRYPNGDLASPEHISHFFRHEKSPSQYYLYLVADCFLLLNTFIICFVTGYFRSQVKNDLNHIISQCYAEKFGSTFISRLAAHIYLKCRNHDWALSMYYTEETGNSDLISYYKEGLKWLKESVANVKSGLK